jgi:cytochrome b561
MGPIALSLRYSPAHQLLHWITAALMAAILPVAWVMSALKEDSPPFYVQLWIHESLGLAILALTLARLVWRIVQRPPAHPASMGPLTRVLAVVVALGLLAMMIVMPISGYLWSNGHGYDIAPFKLVTLPRILFNQKAVGDLAKAVHETGRWLVYGLIGLHLAGVVWHVAFRRDGLLGRMLPPQAREA